MGFLSIVTRTLQPFLNFEMPLGNVFIVVIITSFVFGQWVWVVLFLLVVYDYNFFNSAVTPVAQLTLPLRRRRPPPRYMVIEKERRPSVGFRTSQVRFSSWFIEKGALIWMCLVFGIYCGAFLNWNNLVVENMRRLNHEYDMINLCTSNNSKYSRNILPAGSKIVPRSLPKQLLCLEPWSESASSSSPPWSSPMRLERCFPSLILALERFNLLAWYARSIWQWSRSRQAGWRRGVAVCDGNFSYSTVADSGAQWQCSATRRGSHVKTRYGSMRSERWCSEEDAVDTSKTPTAGEVYGLKHAAASNGNFVSLIVEFVTW